MKKITFILVLLFASNIEAQTIRKVYVGGTSGAGDETYTNTQLQSCLDDAEAGDSCLLQENIEYLGNFTIKEKSCPANDSTCYVTIRTGVNSAGTELPASDFPAENIRITPVFIDKLAKLKVSSNNVPALTTAAAPAVVKWYRIKWLEFKSNTYGGNALLNLGNDSSASQSSKALIPDQFIIEQNYVHGDSATGQFRGMAIHAKNVVIKDNYIEDIKSVDEGQGIWIQSTTGPVTVENNFVSGGTETFFTGGSSGCCVQGPTVVSNATTTSAVWSAVTDLEVGQGISMAVAGAKKYAEVVSIGSSTCTGSANANCVVWTPAYTAAVDTPGDIDYGVVVKDLTIRKNHFTRPLSWRNGIVPTPSNVTATPNATGGTLAAGTYFYRVSARHLVAVNQTARSTASAEVSAVTTGITSSVVISWNSVPNATVYYIYGRTSGGQNVRFSVNSPTTTFTDTGAAGTAETVPSGSNWQVKNTFELKNCDTCVIEGNVIENVWKSAQDGTLVLLTGTTSSAGNDSSHVRNITFRYNIVRSGNGCVQMTGRDAGGHESGRNGNFNIHDNLFYDINGNTYGNGLPTRCMLFTVGGWLMDPALNWANYDITINHNTVEQSNGTSAVYFDNYRNPVYYTVENLIITNNIFRKQSWGMIGGGTGEGVFTSWAGAGSLYDKNIFAAANCGIYPAGTSCPTATTLQNDVYTSFTTNNFRVKSTSTFFNAGLDGKSYGADIDLIEPLTNIALSGDNTGGAIPPPPALIITTGATLPSKLVGEDYCVPTTINIVVSGGVSPYTWSVISGALPTGLTLNSSVGSICGSASISGVFSFRIRVTDSQGTPATVEKDFDVTISEIIIPIPRPDKFNMDERVTFARDVCPDGTADSVKKGDTCFDLVEERLKYASETSPTVIWKPLGSLIPVTVFTFVENAAVTWTNMPSATTEFLGIQNLTRFKLDLSNAREIRVVTFVQTIGAANAKLGVEFWNGSAWTSIGVTDNAPVSINVSGEMSGAWTVIASAARADVPVRIVGVSGDGVIDPIFANVAIQVR